MKRQISLTGIFSLNTKGKGLQAKGFTLVELIVVITILAILGTIAFISLQGYSANARDSKRISDVNSIKTSLGLFFVHSGKYPIPDSGVEYSFSGELLWTQGFVGETVIKNLSRNIQEIPLDPSMDTQYVYSLSSTKTEYEILANYELDNISNNNLNNGAYAANFTPKITGTYNQIYVKTQNYIIPSPSIINALNQTTDFNTNNQAIQSQVTSLGENNIANGKISSSTGALTDFALTYTGAINSKSSDAEKISVINTLQQAYSGTRFASNSEISYILSKNTDEDKKNLVEQIILNSGVVNSNTPQDQNQDQETPIDYCSGINNSMVSYWNFNQEYNDNFNGTSINNNLWTVINNETATTLTQNEKIIIQQTSYSGVWLSPRINSTYFLSGDFDVQVDYNILNSGTGERGIRLQVFSQDNKNQYVNYRNFGQGKYRAQALINGVRSSTINEASTTDTNGKLRITRVGNILTSYYWKSSTSSWVSIGSHTDNSSQGYLTQNLFVQLTYVSYQSNGGQIELDNFKINKGSIIYDSIGTNDGKINGSTTWTTGKVLKALSFDGVDDFVGVADSSSLDITQQVSLSVWLKPNTSTPSEPKYIAGKFKYSDNNRSYLLYQQTNGKIYFVTSSDGSASTNSNLISTSSLNAGTRNHIVGTYDGTKMKLYINGELSSEMNNTSGIYSSTAPFRIAGSGESTPTNLLNGSVDEVAVFNKGLSQEEVTKIYNDGLAGNNICGN